MLQLKINEKERFRLSRLKLRYYISLLILYYNKAFISTTMLYKGGKTIFVLITFGN